EGNKVLGAIEKIVSWAKEQKIFSDGTLFGMSIDDPHVTPRALYRYEVCFSSASSFRCAEDMSKTKMPAMRYAVVKVAGDIKMVATAWDYLFRGWLINSTYEPEHAPALEIFTNKEGAMDWSHFELDLCLPIKKLEKTEDL
ncbi:MAG: GyrI-like domain-containing protein, partial [Bdellovibrionota bacterium]